MFLVLLRCSSDDLPLALFDTEAAAVEFSKSVDETPTPKICDLFKLDPTDSICISVIEFANGYPEKVTTVRRFDE